MSVGLRKKKNSKYFHNNTENEISPVEIISSVQKRSKRFPQTGYWSESGPNDYPIPALLTRLLFYQVGLTRRAIECKP